MKKKTEKEREKNVYKYELAGNDIEFRNCVCCVCAATIMSKREVY